jgi:hypothetical protein
LAPSGRLHTPQSSQCHDDLLQVRGHSATQQRCPRRLNRGRSSQRHRHLFAPLCNRPGIRALTPPFPESSAHGAACSDGAMRHPFQARETTHALRATRAIAPLFCRALASGSPVRSPALPIHATGSCSLRRDRAPHPGPKFYSLHQLSRHQFIRSFVNLRDGGARPVSADSATTTRYNKHSYREGMPRPRRDPASLGSGLASTSSTPTQTVQPDAQAFGATPESREGRVGKGIDHRLQQTVSVRVWY